MYDNIYNSIKYPFIIIINKIMDYLDCIEIKNNNIKE